MQNRNQQTTVNGHTSTAAPVTYGTAQGSILGPLIFILYVDDMFKSVTLSSNIYMYADDTLIISRSDNINSVTKKCSEGIEKVSSWCEANKLTMNYKKTKCMIVKHKKTPDVQNIIVRNKQNIIVRNKQISIVHTYEYLGVLIDEKLSHNDYIESISKKTNNKIGILSRIRFYFC